MQLGRAAGDAIEFLNGQFQRAIILRTAAEQRSEPANLENRLHGAFAESVLVAHDHRAAVILQRRGENFARRRALPAGQNNQRSGVGNARIRIARDDDVFRSSLSSARSVPISKRAR